MLVLVAAFGCAADGPGSEAGDAGEDASGDGSAEGSASASGSDATAGSDSGEGGEETPRWEHLIRADPYPRLVIEVDYVAGRAPRPFVADELEATFATLLDKPAGVAVVLDEMLPESAPDRAWTSAERVELMKATSDLEVADGTIKIHALFLDGHAAENDGTDRVLLGLAWGHENVVIFRDTLDASCEGAIAGPLLDQLCAEAEFLVVQHELGHIIGLVDAGLPMVEDHRDPNPDAGRHDADPSCVMYHAYESLDAVDVTLDRLLAGGPAIEFDAACIADIDAVRSRP